VSEPERIGIRELRQHASRYVAMAKAGKRIAVTDRGELVAYLVPAQEPTTTFQRMVAAAGRGRPRERTDGRHPVVITDSSPLGPR
jgi:prevent-host-death family protein